MYKIPAAVLLATIIGTTPVGASDTSNLNIIYKQYQNKNSIASKQTNAKESKNLKTEDNITNSDYARKVVDLVNVERKKVGLQALTLNNDAQGAAQIRAKEIEAFFSHSRPDGGQFSSVLKEEGIIFQGAGENIASGQATPEEVVKSWMNSEGHRANILDKNYTDIGVGYYENTSGTPYWVQLFTY